MRKIGRSQIDESVAKTRKPMQSLKITSNANIFCNLSLTPEVMEYQTMAIYLLVIAFINVVAPKGAVC